MSHKESKRTPLHSRWILSAICKLLILPCILHNELVTLTAIVSSRTESVLREQHEKNKLKRRHLHNF